MSTRRIIDYLESSSCEEIFAARERQYQDSYRRIPALDELCSRYGDLSNRRIYMIKSRCRGQVDGFARTRDQALRPRSIDVVRRLFSAPTLCYVTWSQLSAEARQSVRLNDNRKDAVWLRTS